MSRHVRLLHVRPAAGPRGVAVSLAGPGAFDRQSRRVGCHEALFTLGERPELRYHQAARWLADHGYESTIAYVAAAARRALDETGLLPT